MSELSGDPVSPSNDLIESHLSGVEFYEFPYGGFAEKKDRDYIDLQRSVTRRPVWGRWCAAILIEHLDQDVITKEELGHFTQLGVYDLTAEGRTSTNYLLNHNDGRLSISASITPWSEKASGILAARITAIVEAISDEMAMGVDRVSIEDWQSFYDNLLVGEWTDEPLGWVI